MFTCLPTSRPLPTYPLSPSARLMHAWLQGRIRLTFDGSGWVKLNFDGSITWTIWVKLNYISQMRGSQVIIRRSMPKGYPRELENCNKIFLCSQTGTPTDEKGLNDSIEDKVGNSF